MCLHKSSTDRSLPNLCPNYLPVSPVLQFWMGCWRKKQSHSTFLVTITEMNAHFRFLFEVRNCHKILRLNGLRLISQHCQWTWLSKTINRNSKHKITDIQKDPPGLGPIAFTLFKWGAKSMGIWLEIRGAMYIAESLPFLDLAFLEPLFQCHMILRTTHQGAFMTHLLSWVSHTPWAM